jgi:hypothetical protein
MSNVTIVIPVREHVEVVQKFVMLNNPILTSNYVIVIDSGGGKPLKKLASHYEFLKCDLSLARKKGIDLVKTKYTLNLDADTILPERYLTEVAEILEDEDIIALAIDYEELQGHLAFGTSIWKTEILKKLYDWSPRTAGGVCECVYMWSKIHKAGGRLETLPYRAKHLKQ